jgi:ATP-dependent Lhr-like helicase
LTRDELVESVALLRSVREGDLDRIRPLETPLDVLAQQVVAEVSAEEWSEDGLFALVRRAHPYRELSREAFDQVVEMVARGYASQRGRRAAYVHRDVVNHRLRARRGARITAITSGGAIPEVADYRVVLEPSETFIGSLNEDFAIESMAGDVFQLGNATWRILKIETGTVRVADAAGEPPSIPFWFGEAPARSLELSEAVSRLREEVSERLVDPEAAIEWLASHQGVPYEAARQLVEYLGQAKHLLGVIPSLRTLVLERFFDEAGGMQLVLHAPFGSRVNRAWGLALRKRFCRSFNFELQAAATEEAVLLSLGPQHSFPLDDVFRYLHPASVRDILIQALLDAPVFQTRWRWNATISLGVLRRQGGRKVPPQIQRMQSEDLLAAVFPDAAACLENIEGDRELPDHPLVRQVIHDCLHEFCDLDVLTGVLRRIHAGDLKLVARDTPEPSTLSHEILNARPYSFLDPAPLEERRTQAVRTRRALDPTSASELGALDPAAIERVREEARPDARDADELHDALLTSGFLTASEGVRGGPECSTWLDELAREGRAVRVSAQEQLWVAVERLPELLAVLGSAGLAPHVDPRPVAAFATPAEDADAALRDVLRARMEILGPVTVAELGHPLGLDEAATEHGLVFLEREGTVLRGAFTARGRSGDSSTREWCDRRLLARVHRYTLERLRAEIEPVSAADYMRFLFSWQRVSPESRLGGAEGLAEVIRLMDGYELAAGAWETDVLPARCSDYEPAALDTLCLTGRVGWGRLTPPSVNRETNGETNGGAVRGPNGEGHGTAAATPIRSTKIALFVRSNGNAWRALAGAPNEVELSRTTTQVLEVLASRGPSFFHELVEATGMLAGQVDEALGQLVGLGIATSDGFTGLRALLTPASRRLARTSGARGPSTSPFGIEGAGRWSLVGRVGDHDRERATEELARSLLRRYGVVFRAVLAREPLRVPWRDLLRTYRRLEARGEIRGGRFVSGFSGEQFALPEAVGKLRAVRKQEPSEDLIAVSAVDPLNLTGIVTPGPRVPAVSRNRVLYRAGIPVAALVRGRAVRLGPDVDLAVGLDRKGSAPALEPALPPSLEQALVRRRVAPAVRAYIGSRS